jgi:chemotaxis protein methyltransferase CheR
VASPRAGASLAAPLGVLASACPISDQEFHRIQELIYREAGISLSESKRALVCSRLAKRLRRLGLADHTQYLEYLATKDHDGTERQAMINCLTTNKTDFFREPHHFEFLRDVVFPQAEERAARGQPRRLRIWSAGCSIGHEPYTIAITAREHFGSSQGWDIHILASDINTEVIRTAQQGVYPLEQIEHLEDDVKRKYFLRGSGECEGYCQVRPELRRMITFRQINLMARPWPIQIHFDVIFCRNVIIYFDLDTQRQLTLRFADQLAPKGYLMLGHSEHPTWLTEFLAPRGQTVYQRVTTDAIEEKSATTEPARPVASEPPPAPEVETREIVSGQIYASRQPTRIATLLGSCIAACLFDPQSRIGGMNHFMLPFHTSDPTVSARYGIHAMELLINDIMKLGGDRRRLQAKVFGGSSVLQFEDSPWNVAQRNCQFVRDFLHTEKIPIVAQRLGGNQPLRVYFMTDTGKALVKVLPAPRQLLDREQQYSRQVSERLLHPQTDNVTLF